MPAPGGIRPVPQGAGPHVWASWLALVVVAILAAWQGPRLADPFRWTLYVILLYLLLTNADRFTVPIRELNRGLGGFL